MTARDLRRPTGSSRRPAGTARHGAPRVPSDDRRSREIPLDLAYCNGPPRKGAKPVAKIAPASSRSASSMTPSRRAATASFSIGRINRSSRSAGRLRRLGRRADHLAVAPDVESLAALAPELLVLHLFRPGSPARAVRRPRRARRRRAAPHPSRPRPRARSGPTGMPNRVPACVDHARGDPFREREQRLIDVGHQNTVDHESGRAFARQRELVELAREPERLAHRLLIRAGAADDLDQLHLRDRIEEMNPDQAARDRAASRPASRSRCWRCWSPGPRRA